MSNLPGDFMRGLRYGLLFSLLLWALIGHVVWLVWWVW